MKALTQHTAAAFMMLLLIAGQGLAHDHPVVVPLLGGAVGDAVPTDVVQGKTFSSQDGKGLTGTLVLTDECTGDATESDVVTGRTFSNASDTGLTGSRPLVPVAKTGITRTDHTGDDSSRRIFYGEPIPNPRFSPFLSLDGSRFDNLTGLSWHTSPEDLTRTWTEAIDYCEDLVTGGFFGFPTVEDWRLPNINELLSIVNRAASNPALEPGIFTMPATYDWFWTSTPWGVGSGTSATAWAVHLGYGAVNNHSKTTTYHALCVRGQFRPLIFVPLSSEE